MSQNLQKIWENVWRNSEKFWRNFWESLRKFLIKSEKYFYQGQFCFFPIISLTVKFTKYDVQNNAEIFILYILFFVLFLIKLFCTKIQTDEFF